MDIRKRRVTYLLANNQITSNINQGKTVYAPSSYQSFEKIKLEKKFISCETHNHFRNWLKILMTLRHTHNRDCVTSLAWYCVTGLAWYCVTGLAWYWLNKFPHYIEINLFLLIYMRYHSMSCQNMNVNSHHSLFS